MAMMDSAAPFFSCSKPQNVFRMTCLAQPGTWTAAAVSSHPLGAAMTTAGILLVSLLCRIFPLSTPNFLRMLRSAYQLMIYCASPLPFFNSTGHVNVILQNELVVDKFHCKSTTEVMESLFDKISFLSPDEPIEGEVCVYLAHGDNERKDTVWPTMGCPRFLDCRHTVSVIVVIINLVTVTKLIRINRRIFKLTTDRLTIRVFVVPMR